MTRRLWRTLRRARNTTTAWIPWWTLRLGAVPFWTKFNTQVSARALEAYLDQSEPYDEIDLMLFAHGVRSIGLAPIERWRAVLARARQGGRFVGVDE